MFFKNLRSLRTNLKEASTVDRNDFKTALKVCLGVIAVAAAVATTIMLTATTAPVLPVLAGVAIWAGVMSTVTVQATADTLAEDVKAGKKEVEWETVLGQKIKSTASQQKDLQWAQKKLLKTTPANFKSIAGPFQSVANKVAVIQDIPNGNGKFRYGQRKLA